MNQNVEKLLKGKNNIFIVFLRKLQGLSPINYRLPTPPFDLHIRHATYTWLIYPEHNGSNGKERDTSDLSLAHSEFWRIVAASMSIYLKPFQRCADFGFWLVNFIPRQNLHVTAVLPVVKNSHELLGFKNPPEKSPSLDKRKYVPEKEMSVCWASTTEDRQK